MSGRYGWSGLALASAVVVLASACGSDSNGDSSAGGSAGAGASAGRAGAAAGGGSAGRGGAAGASTDLGDAGDAAAGASGATTQGVGGVAGAANGGADGGGDAGGESSSGAGGEAGCAGLECQPHKLVFVTSGGHNGNFGGVAGADKFCQDSADAARLSGTFKAWLSAADVSTSPSVRFTHSTMPYLLVDGTLIANDWADLTDGSIAHDLDLTELGIIYSDFVYTFTLADGTPGLAGSISDKCYGDDCNCNDWTNDQLQGTPAPGSAVGQPYVTDKGWTDYSFYNGCAGDASLYCFEQ